MDNIKLNKFENQQQELQKLPKKEADVVVDGFTNDPTLEATDAKFANSILANLNEANLNEAKSNRGQN